LAGSHIPPQQPLHAQGCERTQHLIDRRCSCEACGLRSIFPSCSDSWSQKHLRWHTILDGPWGNMSCGKYL